MKRRLRRLYWVGIMITMAMAVIAVGMMVKLKIDDTRENLRSILQAASAWTLETTEDLQSMAKSIASVSPPLRVTFLLEQGMVLADSEENARTMENHAERPEVLMAINGGVGESLRFSDTQAMVTLYAAMRISPVLILRLSYPLSQVADLLAVYCVGLVCLFLVLYILQRRALSRLGNDLLLQMDKVRRLLEGEAGHSAAVFCELQPALDNISYLAARLRGDLREVSRTLSLRDNFVANASHELRSPLTSIMGFSEMLDEGMADSVEERELCVQMIRGECQRMLRVIEDILNLSRAEAHSALELLPIDVGALAREIAISLSPQAEQKGISINVEGEMTRDGVETDFWEMLYNLVGNAVRYGREGGHVWIRLTEDEISVEDDGTGIASEHIPHIFEQFYRVDEARGMVPDGTGLGLSIVKALTERHGAHIAVESESGVGSRFVIGFTEKPENQTPQA